MSEPTKQELNENFLRTIKTLGAKQAYPKSRSASDVSAGFFRTILPKTKAVRRQWMYLIRTLGRTHMTLSMVKQEVRSCMSVKVFVTTH
jgi:hypothetical protein